MKAAIFSVIVLFICANADQLTDLDKSCDVGEGAKTVAGGLCNGADAANQCNSYCKNTYGNEYLASECTDPRANGKKECICKLKCCNQGCWGDPHCWTCDGASFTYQGTTKVYLLKPCKKYATLPHFEVRQVNKYLDGKGPVAFLNVSELVIPEWGQNLQVLVPTLPTDNYILTVNGKQATVPFTWSDQKDYKENYVSAVFASGAQKQIVITTSFGLVIKISVHPGSEKEHPGQCYSDVSIDIPRHPDLKGNICGLLGRWNDNKNDESVGSNGQNYTLDNSFSWDFGNSWIVPDEGEEPCECEMRQQEKKHKQKVDNADPKVKNAARNLCAKNLNNPDLQACFKRLQRPGPDVNNCVVDLLYAGDGKEDWDTYLNGLLSKFAITCNEKFAYHDLDDPKCSCQ